MFNFTAEERKVTVFLLCLALAGLILSQAVKINRRLSGMVYPQMQLAKLNLNKVNLKELGRVKVLPVKLAQKIIQYRSLHGEFGCLEELREVKGIGDVRFEKLKEIFFIE
jgi:competence protein ComEA